MDEEIQELSADNIEMLFQAMELLKVVGGAITGSNVANDLSKEID